MIYRYNDQIIDPNIVVMRVLKSYCIEHLGEVMSKQKLPNHTTLGSS